jgi:hypothetical protein
LGTDALRTGRRARLEKRVGGLKRHEDFGSVSFRFFASYVGLERASFTLFLSLKGTVLSALREARERGGNLRTRAGSFVAPLDFRHDKARIFL